jgi:hypothetical protein
VCQLFGLLYRITRLTVANFSPIPSLVRHLLVSQHVFLCSSRYLDIRPILLQLLEESFPNGLAIFLSEWWVGDDDVDPGSEGIVEPPNSVCGQKEDAFVVLYAPKEHWKYISLRSYVDTI